MSRLAAWFLVCAGLAATDAAAAQPASGPDSAAALVDAGRYAEARELLDRLLEPGTGGLTGAARARAHLLRGMLASDAEAAESDYQAIILGYPSSPDAAEALLRVAQGALARGDARRAAGYLERLVRDYPAASQRGNALLWLGRAFHGIGRTEPACTAWLGAIQDPRSPAELVGLARAEQAARCPATAASPAAPAAVAPSPPRGAAAGTGPYAVQAGAFSDRASADRLAGQLRGAGFEARTVVVPASPLLRVRVGRFRVGGDAADFAAQLRAAGFDAFVVADADSERPS